MRREGAKRLENPPTGWTSELHSKSSGLIGGVPVELGSKSTDYFP
jgi:hypothetical protein